MGEGGGLPVLCFQVQVHGAITYLCAHGFERSFKHANATLLCGCICGCGHMIGKDNWQEAKSGFSVSV